MIMKLERSLVYIATRVRVHVVRCRSQEREGVAHRQQVHTCILFAFEMAAEQKKDKQSLGKVAKLALCGLGRAGKIHFRGIRTNPRCQLKYIVDCFDVPDVLRDVRAMLEEYRMLDAVTLVKTSDYESVVLGDRELDGVVITTPTQYHESYVKRALLAKKAVFCEKPLAYDIADVVQCYDLAEEHGCPLYCAFQRRFDPGMSKLRNQVVEGKIGKVFQLRSTSRDQPRPSIEYLKCSGGMYHDTAVHDCDMLCWIIGEEPVGVFAQGSAFDPEIQGIGDVDTIVVTLKFPSGVLALMDLSRHANYGYDMRLEVGFLVCVCLLLSTRTCIHKAGTVWLQGVSYTCTYVA